MACLLASGTRVLTCTGKRLNVENLKCGDLVVDVKGISRRIEHIKRREQMNECFRLFLSKYPVPVVVPRDTYVMVERTRAVSTWSHICSVELGDVFSVPELRYWHVPQEIHIISPSDSNVLWKASYDLGYVIGSYIACGFIDDVQHEHYEKRMIQREPELNTTKCKDHRYASFLYDMKPSTDWQKLLDGVYILDPTARVMVIQSQTLRTMHVYSKDILTMLMSIDKTNGLPPELMCSNPSYIKGIYCGMMNSNHIHLNIHMYDLMTWCSQIMQSNGEKQTLEEPASITKIEPCVHTDLYEVLTETSEMGTTCYTHQLIQSSTNPLLL
jgi:hypothetical protein